MENKNIPRWFRITLVGINGENLAMWSWDILYPVIPPHFTYPNNDDKCPYVITFDYVTSENHILRTNCDINHAIYEATQNFITKH